MRFRTEEGKKVAECMISVIVPVYNIESYLRECVESVINQTYPFLEIILVDDGSTDGSGAICDEYATADDRILVIHKKKRGAGNGKKSRSVHGKRRIYWFCGRGRLG